MHQDCEKSIQFIVCPQRDFIGRDAEAASNRLHVGAAAIGRLRGSGGGTDPFVETIRLLFDDSVPGTEQLQVVVEEDWHPRSCEEFPIFGEHCLKGSHGAELAGGLEQFRWHPRTHVVRANSLNIAAVPSYRRLMKRLVGASRPEAIRVGVFGVWTHIKVEYLLLNLRTLYPSFPQLAVCEPLCASPREDDHRHAMSKFRDLGYQVFEEIEGYLVWLGIDPERVAVLSRKLRPAGEKIAAH
ncbi:MAG: hypothetical protein HY319_08290 [Armatimonadetes bacterium]|nr:hypothetical protein [Armatimonadota bacterium]